MRRKKACLIIFTSKNYSLQNLSNEDITREVNNVDDTSPSLHWAKNSLLNSLELHMSDFLKGDNSTKRDLLTKFGDDS